MIPLDLTKMTLDNLNTLLHVYQHPLGVIVTAEDWQALAEELDRRVANLVIKGQALQAIIAADAKTEDVLPKVLRDGEWVEADRTESNALIIRLLTWYNADPTTAEYALSETETIAAFDVRPVTQTAEEYRAEHPWQESEK